MRHRVLALILAAAGSAYGADWEFDHAVKAIENHYGVKRTHIPLLGVANLFVKMAHPAGARGFKLAIFEGLRSTSAYGDTAELDRFMDEMDGRRMHPLVVTHSRRNDESTYILTGEIGKATKMLIASFERNEATLVEVEVDIATLLKTIGSPDEARRFWRVERQDGN